MRISIGAAVMAAVLAAVPLVPGAAFGQSGAPVPPAAETAPMPRAADPAGPDTSAPVPLVPPPAQFQPQTEGAPAMPRANCGSRTPATGV